MHVVEHGDHVVERLAWSQRERRRPARGPQRSRPRNVLPLRTYRSRQVT